MPPGVARTPSPERAPHSPPGCRQHLLESIVFSRTRRTSRLQSARAGRRTMNFGHFGVIVFFVHFHLAVPRLRDARREFIQEIYTCQAQRAISDSSVSQSWVRISFST